MAKTHDLGSEDHEQVSRVLLNAGTNANEQGSAYARALRAASA